MHGYESKTVAEIREILVAKGITDQKILLQTKRPLIDYLLKLEEEETENEAEELFDEVTEEQAEEVEAIPVPEVVPDMNSEEWHDYVMRQFHERELEKNGNPTCVGCRRVVQKLIGPILKACPIDFIPPTKENEGTGTVLFEVTIRVEKEDHPLFEEEITLGDIADVNRFNTDPPFHKHATATAATRAEARIYRKLLGITKITAEELSEAANNDEDFIEDEMIEDGQIEVINMMCGPQRCDINVLDFINCGQNKYSTIHAVSKGTAIRMIQKLNAIQQGIDKRPANVGRYVADWRNNG